MAKLIYVKRIHGIEAKKKILRERKRERCRPTDLCLCVCVCLMSFASIKMLKCVNMGFVTKICDLVKKLCKFHLFTVAMKIWWHCKSEPRFLPDAASNMKTTNPNQILVLFAKSQQCRILMWTWYFCTRLTLCLPFCYLSVTHRIFNSIKLDLLFIPANDRKDDCACATYVSWCILFILHAITKLS